MSQGNNSSRVRRAPLVWVASGIAALVLTLGVNGTLSSWTEAILNNTTNSASTGQAVILREALGTTTCLSSDTASNSSTCSTINKYGGTAAPLTPGTDQTVTVTFTNVGAANASSFSLAPGACSQTPAAGSGTPAAADLCTSGDLTVAVSCSPGTTYAAANAWTDLAYAAAAPPTATKSHAASGGDLNAGSSFTCQFTVALASGAGVATQGITVSQPLSWTLSE